MPWLVQVGPSGTVLRSWELGKRPVTFGRGDDVDAKIEDHEMSRHHFHIDFVNDVHVLTDDNSTNGTWVNGRRATHSYLKSEDRIRAGGAQFLYQVGTSTMLGMAEKAVGGTFKDELKKIYDGVEHAPPG